MDSSSKVSIKCGGCGSMFLVWPSRKNTRFCSPKCCREISHRIIEHLKIDDLEKCWNWEGRKDKDGYGIMICTIDGKKEQRANRISWRYYRGAIPEGLQVLHHCDNPSCINPDHLFVGTGGDNMADKTRKGRNNPPVGERAGNAKLKDEDILEIRRRHANGEVQRRIAESFGVGYKAINKIVLGLRWKHV